jgi:hypothetical protein
MSKPIFAAHGPVLVLLCLIISTATHAALPDCGALCGRWQLDVTASDPVEARIDAALATYRPARDRQARRRMGGNDPQNLQTLSEAELRESLGPITDRPDSSRLRSELLAALTPPQTLQIRIAGTDVLIDTGDRSARSYSPGVPHARVDAQGTARIKAALTSGQFTLSERYDSQRQYTEIYTVQRANGSLQVERQIERPGLKKLRLRAVYKPG